MLFRSHLIGVQQEVYKALPNLVEIWVPLLLYCISVQQKRKFHGYNLEIPYYIDTSEFELLEIVACWKVGAQVQDSCTTGSMIVPQDIQLLVARAISLPWHWLLRPHPLSVRRPPFSLQFLCCI